MTYVLIIWLWVGHSAIPTQVEFGVHAERCEAAKKQVLEELHSITRPVYAICIQK